MWWLFVPAIYFYIGPAFALVPEFGTRAKMRSMAVAITLLIANVLNLIVAPMIVGATERFVCRASGGRCGVAADCAAHIAPTGFWAAWHYWRVEKYIIEDQKRAVGYV